jgi:hypothetical protein
MASNRTHRVFPFRNSAGVSELRGRSFFKDKSEVVYREEESDFIAEKKSSWRQHM